MARQPALPKVRIKSGDLSYAASRRWGVANALGCRPETMRLLEDLIDSAARYQAALTKRSKGHG
jgi:hypothetical protein